MFAWCRLLGALRFGAVLLHESCCFDCGGKFKWMNGQAVPVVERTSVFVVLVFIVVIALGGWLVYSWTLI